MAIATIACISPIFGLIFLKSARKSSGLVLEEASTILIARSSILTMTVQPTQVAEDMAAIDAVSVSL